MKIVLVIYLAKKILTIFKKYALIKICVEFKKKQKNLCLLTYGCWNNSSELSILIIN